MLPLPKARRQLGGAAAGGFALIEEALEFFDDLRTFEVEVRPFARIGLQVVELAGGGGCGIG